VFIPGGAEPTPTFSFAYYIRQISGTFVLQKIGGNATQGIYNFGGAGDDVFLQASIGYASSPDVAYANVSVRLGNLVRCRCVDGGTPPTQQQMESSDWGNACQNGADGSPRLFPSSDWVAANGTSFILSRQVFMSECEYRGAVIALVDQACTNGTESRSVAFAPISVPTDGASAAGCVPPLSMTIRHSVTLLGTPSGTSNVASLTNVKTVYDAGPFNGVIPIWLVSTSLPSAAWPPPVGYLPTDIYSTPTVRHDQQVSVDAIEMLYGASAIPLFADRGKPACAF
jgi:hypothetical protein